MEIGQKVKVRRVRDRVPKNMVDTIRQNPVGTIADFKVLDGSTVGIVIRFNNNFSTWFFPDEVEAVS